MRPDGADKECPQDLDCCARNGERNDCQQDDGDQQRQPLHGVSSIPLLSPYSGVLTTCFTWRGPAVGANTCLQSALFPCYNGTHAILTQPRRAKVKSP